jgi:hypothetical protein
MARLPDRTLDEETWPHFGGHGPSIFGFPCKTCPCRVRSVSSRPTESIARPLSFSLQGQSCPRRPSAASRGRSIVAIGVNAGQRKRTPNLSALKNCSIIELQLLLTARR